MADDLDAFRAGVEWALERAAATPDGPRYTGPICSYCGCSPGEDCDVHECLAHPSAVCRECDGAVDEECWRFNDGVKCEIGIHDPRCNDYHPFAPTGEPEQVPDLGWEVSLAEKSVLARAAGYAAASIEGLEQGDAAFRLLETALDIYGRAVRAESEAQHEATKAYLAETAVAIEARASAAEEQVRVLTETLDGLLSALDYDPGKEIAAFPADGYGEHTCGCSWDSGPYPTYCRTHDPDERAEAAIERAKALRASISTDTKNEEE